jgi:hypothetical protein
MDQTAESKILDQGPLNGLKVPIDYFSLRVIGGRIVTLPRIIAISGKYGTGKDTLATAIKSRLQEAHKLETDDYVLDLKFAAALKECCAAITGTSLEQNYSQTGKQMVIPTLDMSLARLQQVLGTVVRQHIHPDIWVLNVARACADTDKICIITDCRFVNEAVAIQNLGGVVIRLNRDYDSIPDECKAG